MENKYYDGTKLLSLKDLDGNTPEIYLCTTNRTGGKTTYFNRLMVNRYLNKNEKFCLIYRFKYELDDIPSKFFKDIRELFFSEHEMTDKPICSGSCKELFIDDKSCGYAVSLNSADTVKRYSHMFNDVSSMLFDEFQSETNHYCQNEVQKLMSIHTSVARGQGKQVRYVPIYMISNPVSIINPYYVELGISARLNNETKFLKGHGFVLEQGFNETASNAQLESGFNKAFSKNKYLAYSAQNVYLNDNLAFVENMNGYSKYIMTVKCNGTDFAIREYPNEGIIYCDYTVDNSFKNRIVVQTEDFEKNYIMLQHNDLILQIFKKYFNMGLFRFKDLRCKECVLTLINYI